MAVALSQQDSQTEEWFALQVRSNHEKSVQTFLQAKGYGAFVPLYRKRSRWSDRIKNLDLPLFPGYVFGQFFVQRRMPILTIPGVITIVGAGRTPVPVDQAQIDAIRCLVSSGLPVMPWPFLQVGDRVVIERGPLEGIEGILVRTRGCDRLVLSIDLLQRSAAVEIDREIVRPVSSPSMRSVNLSPRGAPGTQHLT